MGAGLITEPAETGAPDKDSPTSLCELLLTPSCGLSLQLPAKSTPPLCFLKAAAEN
jgi:hypothetical protein